MIERSTKEKSALSAIEYTASVSRSSSKQEYKECHQSTACAVASEPLDKESSQTNGINDELRPKPITKERSLNSSHSHSRRSSAKSHHSETSQQVSAGADDCHESQHLHNSSVHTQNDDVSPQPNGSSEVEEQIPTVERSATKTSLQSFLQHEQEEFDETKT